MTVGGRLRLTAGAHREMTAHLEAAYPREGCGVLLGEVDGGTRRVLRVRPAENRWPDRDDRYLVDPGTLRRLQDREAEDGPRILGFYHSHPDAEPRPSETDRAHAWPWYHYLIVPVREGRAGDGRAWELTDDGDFAERPAGVDDPADAEDPGQPAEAAPARSATTPGQDGISPSGGGEEHPPGSGTYSTGDGNHSTGSGTRSSGRNDG